MTKLYLLTRFNLALYKRNKYFRSVRHEDWLRERCELFERFCLPSVVGQSCQDYVWLVLFDADTPAPYVERIRSYERACPNLRPIWVDASEAWSYVRILRRAIAQDLECCQAEGLCCERVITTCLDNDDALALDFVERTLRVSGSLGAMTFVSFRSGMQYFTNLRMATRIKYPNNHFLSLIETPNEGGLVRTVFGFGDHSRLLSFGGVAVYVDEGEVPAWLEVVHGANIANDVYMHSLVALETEPKALRVHFGLDVELSPRAKRIYYTRYRLRWLREFFRKVFLRLLRYVPERFFSNRYSA